MRPDEIVSASDEAQEIKDYILCYLWNSVLFTYSM
jgi:hypothetical protein